MIVPVAISYNTFVVMVGVAAVGFAAGVIGCLSVLRRRALVGDAAAHATLIGVACAFLATGRRDLSLLLAGALVSAIASLGLLVLLRCWTRTRDDAATAIVQSVSFGLGITLISGITARGIANGAGLEQFLLGHTAALTAGDAILLGLVSCAAVGLLLLGFKEATLVAFDASFAAATGWPVLLLDYGLVALVAVMMVVGLPAAGAVLVTALVVIPPVAARQWTDRVSTMLLLSGLFGLFSAVVGVLTSALVPRLATGPMVVLVAASIVTLSFFCAPVRGWLARAIRLRQVQRSWAEGRVLTVAQECATSADAASQMLFLAGTFAEQDVRLRVACDDGGRNRDTARAWRRLVDRKWIERFPRAATLTTHSSAPGSQTSPELWQLTQVGREKALERARRLRLWDDVFAVSRDDAREFLTIDLPAPEAVLTAARLAVIQAAVADR